jgi:argininosuccinate synthase
MTACPSKLIFTFALAGADGDLSCIVDDRRRTPHPALIGAAMTTTLTAVLPEGGAEAIASRGKSPDHDELLDHAAMEFGTD